VEAYNAKLEVVNGINRERNQVRLVLVMDPQIDRERNQVRLLLFEWLRINIII
jgi:hypothetical protein